MSKVNLRQKLKINLETLTFKTFLRGFLTVGFFILIVIGLIINQRPFKSRLREGDIALKSIYAPYDFVYSGEPDNEKTVKEQQKAIKSIKDVYSLDGRVLDEGIVALDKFFGSADSMKLFSKYDGLSVLSVEAKHLLSLVYENGVLSVKDKARIQESGETDIIIFNKAAGTEKQVGVARIPGVDEALRDLYDRAKKVISDKKMVQAVVEVLQNEITANLLFEKIITEARRQEAAASVPVQYKQISIKKGELIISKGQRANKDHMAQFLAIEKNEIQRSRGKFTIGALLLVFLLLSVVTIYLILYEPKIFHNTSYLTLIGVLSVAIIFIARAIIVSPLPSYVIPLASISMLIAILLNQRLAIFITIILGLAISINVENSLNLAIMFLFGGLIGIFSTRNIRKRWHIIRSGILVGGVNALSIISISLLNNLNVDSFLADGLWGFGNGILCVFIVMSILPLLEDIFNITTNITLLELSDMNHPLLKDMMVKAAGTYHHSLMVGNLAEAAAETVGANSLLARVGAYYHDIGKIAKAEYFTENHKAGSKVLHDKLTPSMSRLIITSHVKDGVELGRKYKLRRDILDFVEQHHGTGLVYYFFQKALERIEDDGVLKEEGFRYEGPKPQTRETAIVLMADSVEAASRSLTNPNPANIEELVHRIINNKFIDGQLDECELTLRDLNKISGAFIRVLIGVTHTRIEYPDIDKAVKDEHKHN
ncbi:MAG: hypothetical protein COW11_06125 [Candidatus Omnitrophica bacterium CG12_big_fil_rev_8_21_14_0_65_43_15]|uniref:HD/PDEase domain-containing protein n=1 Tax=Candidatus Taenaricola geysiri TaxID=1974752 RepID=A0A2J0LFC2_9BACT|nr:MAG: hypothetical protein COS48_02990 [Candidatus Omnitrophica bacterium CG03_land_8_20_14_0_80_43_22]PIW65909.1 MAG: hypothetical protein COW11_06125 [Candidatus Omnitrophica bacterium CG12_big_fil_rev_8_21_14_0_65_43_15]PIY83608.1 MAG: hypothetical protein COY77_05145 [Candidatus Omnitrophica bacterium CG_4_10_14_0_8_um_filter_43_18]PJC45957.1 MAG: hypothetical protein CO036_05395 [Candidatus Omnitrophica bacterium CG_4_9_14_0_2_um_filter_43_12]